MPVKRLKAIAAMSSNEVIAQNGVIPWHEDKDMRWFKQMTINNVVIMGRKTFESLRGKPLPNRHNIVITRSHRYLHADVETLDSLDLLHPENDKREYFICGGAELYHQTLDRCSDLYLTTVKIPVYGMSLTYFPFDLVSQYYKIDSIIYDDKDISIVHYVNNNL